MKEAMLKDLLRECSATITEKTQEIYNLMPGAGDAGSNVMIITTHPTAKEETTGIYFEGKSGKNFNGFLDKCQRTRDDLYMTYAVKYRPYKISDKTGRIINREVTMEEARMFYPFLLSEIETVAPKLLVTFGQLAYSAIYNFRQQDAPDYGRVATIKLGGNIYELLPLPHPSEGLFNKIDLGEAALKALKKGTVNQETPTKPEVESEPKPAFKPLIPGSKAEATEGKEEKAVYDNVDRPVPKRTKKKITGKHRVILVYGGSQLSNDPSHVVAERVSSVLAELNVGIKRIDLYKKDWRMEDFLDAMVEADGVIMATTVEWYGIGGLLQTFMDKIYLSGQMSVFEGSYLFNIVISRHGFEREGLNHVLRSWEILGGIEGVNLCAAIESSAQIETSSDLLHAIDKKAEDFYRVINQQRIPLPTSINDNKVVVRIPTAVEEAQPKPTGMSRPLPAPTKEKTGSPDQAPGSSISNYDEFIEKQQKDIEDIASLFKERLGSAGDTSAMTLPQRFEHHYKPTGHFDDCIISWVVNDSAAQNFVLNFKGNRLKTAKGKNQEADVIISSNLDILEQMTEGKLTVQRAFMTGEVKAKGNFTLLYKLDGLFDF